MRSITESKAQSSLLNPLLSTSSLNEGNYNVRRINFAMGARMQGARGEGWGVGWGEGWENWTPTPTRTRGEISVQTNSAKEIDRSNFSSTSHSLTP